jgi:hypothetical protein
MMQGVCMTIDSRIVSTVAANIEHLMTSWGFTDSALTARHSAANGVVDVLFKLEDEKFVCLVEDPLLICRVGVG